MRNGEEIERNDGMVAYEKNWYEKVGKKYENSKKLKTKAKKKEKKR